MLVLTPARENAGSRMVFPEHPHPLTPYHGIAILQLGIFILQPLQSIYHIHSFEILAIIVKGSIVNEDTHYHNTSLSQEEAITHLIHVYDLRNYLTLRRDPPPERLSWTKLDRPLETKLEFGDALIEEE